MSEESNEPTPSHAVRGDLVQNEDEVVLEVINEWMAEEAELRKTVYEQFLTL